MTAYHDGSIYRLMTGSAARTFLFVAFLLPQAAEAATRYVSTTGNDSNAGTVDAPWRTLNYALSHVACGDLIYARAGTYASVNTQAVRATSCSSFVNPVTLRANPGEAVHMPMIAVYAERYLVFEDLILDGAPSGTPGETLCIGCGFSTKFGGGGYLRFVNLDIHGNNTPNIDVHTASIVSVSSGSIGYNEFIGGSVHHGSGVVGDGRNVHGFYISAPYNVVDGVEIHHTDGYAIHNYSDNPSNNVYRNNYIHHTGKSTATVAAITLNTGNGNIAYNNVVVWNSNGIGTGGGTSGNKFYNNTVSQNGVSGSGADGSGCGRYCYPAINAAGNVTELINNIVFGNYSDMIDDYGTGTVKAANLFTTPGFVTAGTNFRLQPQSAAIDAGVALPSIVRDFSGAVRPQGGGLDIGAYEYGGSGAPAPATDVKVLRK